MSMTMQCFSIEELEPLDEHQRALLRNALEREIRNSPEIHKILRGKIQPLYDRMMAQRPTPPAPASRARRTRRPG
jgi:hypothetical protein